MSFILFDEKTSKNGGRKYPASEYSDRVINLNRLEDRNLESQCRQIERERRTVINSINREKKIVEADLEDKQDLMRALFNKEKLSVLSKFPYRFSVGANHGITIMEELDKLRLLHNNRLTSQENSRKMSSILRQPAPIPSSTRAAKVHSAHGRLLPERPVNDVYSSQTPRPLSSLENYEKPNIKPTVIWLFFQNSFLFLSNCWNFFV